MEITTKSGFTCEMDRTVLDNMELVDGLAEMNGGNPLAISTVCRLMLGKETRARLYDHLRNEEGRVPVTDLDRELTEIMQAMGDQGKN